MMNFILMPAVIMITIMIYFTMMGAAKPRRNVLFGVTLHSEALEEEVVLQIIDEYKRNVNRCVLGSVLTGLPILFIDKTAINMVYLIVWSLITSEWLVKQAI